MGITALFSVELTSMPHYGTNIGMSDFLYIQLAKWGKAVSLVLNNHSLPVDTVL